MTNRLFSKSTIVLFAAVAVNALIDVIVAVKITLVAFGPGSTATDAGFIIGPLLLVGLLMLGDAALIVYLALKRRPALARYYLFSRIAVFAILCFYASVNLTSGTDFSVDFSSALVVGILIVGLGFVGSTAITTFRQSVKRWLLIVVFALYAVMAAGLISNLSVQMKAVSSNPGSGRAGTLRDEHTEQSIHVAQYEISSYAIKANALPASLADITLSASDKTRISDDNIVYNATGFNSYELCATFFTNSTRRIYSHSTGYQCIPFTESLMTDPSTSSNAAPESTTGGATIQTITVQ